MEDKAKTSDFKMVKNTKVYDKSSHLNTVETYFPQTVILFVISVLFPLSLIFSLMAVAFSSMAIFARAGGNFNELRRFVWASKFMQAMTVCMIFIMSVFYIVFFFYQ